MVRGYRFDSIRFDSQCKVMLPYLVLRYVVKVRKWRPKRQGGVPFWSPLLRQLTQRQTKAEPGPSAHTARFNQEIRQQTKMVSTKSNRYGTLSECVLSYHVNCSVNMRKERRSEKNTHTSRALTGPTLSNSGQKHRSSGERG